MLSAILQHTRLPVTRVVRVYLLVKRSILMLTWSPLPQSRLFSSPPPPPTFQNTEFYVYFTGSEQMKRRACRGSLVSPLASPFRCTACEMRFIREVHYIKHVRNRHGRITTTPTLNQATNSLNRVVRTYLIVSKLLVNVLVTY